MSSIALGCLKFGSSYEVIRPDLVYTEAHSKPNDPPGDFVEIKKEYFSCKKKYNLLGQARN